MRIHFLLFTFFIIFCANAQRSLNITIQVHDGKSRFISGIDVCLTEKSLHTSLHKTTDANGKVNFVLTEGNVWSIKLNGILDKKTLQVEEGYKEQMLGLPYDPVMTARMSLQKPERNSLVKEEQNFYTTPQIKPGYVIAEVVLEKKNSSRVGNTKVSLVCHKLGKEFRSKTNANGMAIFLVPCDNKYDIDIDGALNLDYIDFGKRDGEIQTVTLQYEPLPITETDIRDTITQDIAYVKGASTGRAYYTIHVMRNDGRIAVDEPIYLAEINGVKVYKAITDANGDCRFLLPTGKKYMVHFRYQKDVDVLDISECFGFFTGNMKITYNPDPKLEYPDKFIPGADNLFLTEFEYFIKKQMPQPRNKPFDIILRWANTGVNKNAKEALMEIDFVTDKNYTSNVHHPLNICFVLDRSGSMAGYYRIEKLKGALKKYIVLLKPDDIISIVTFEDNMRVLLSAQKIGNDKSGILQLINDIDPGGGTNIYNGLVEGYEQVLHNMNTKYVNRVILLSDGYGSDDPLVTINKSREYNTKGVDISAIGVGADYNYSLLKQLTTNGGGLFQYVGDSNQMDEIFLDEMRSVTNPIAKDALVEIFYNDRIIFKQIYGFPFYKQGNDKVSMTMKNIYPGLKKLALVKFDLKNADSTIENKAVTVKISYTEAATGTKKYVEEKARLNWNSYKGYELVYEAEDKKLYCIAVMNQALKVMAEAFDDGENKKAKDAINNAVKEVKSIYPEAKDNDVKNLMHELENYASIFKNLADKGEKRKK